MVYNTYVKIDTINKVKEFSDTMSHFKEPIYLESGSYIADAKSILGIMGLNLLDKMKLVVEANDESAFDKITSSISKFII